MPEKSVNEIPRDLRPLFTKGNDALARENFDYAINLFHQVLAREPAVVDCRKALRKAQLGKADAKGGGGGFFKKVFSSAGSAPQVAKAQMALSKNPMEAMAIAEQVLDSDPTNSSAHRVIAEAATALELPQTIVMSLEVLVKNSPKDKGLRLVEFQDVLLSLPADSGSHEGCSRRGEQDLAMRGDVIAVGMADEDFFRSGLGAVRVEPQAKLRQVEAADAQFNTKQGHAGSVGRQCAQSNAVSDKGHNPNVGK